MRNDALATVPLRRYYLDWLRVLMILLTVFSHTVMPFNDAADWAIKNSDTTFIATAWMGFVFQWGMQLFFFAAGATAWLSLRHRSPREYVRERLKRLLVPYLLALITLSPLEDYLEKLHRGLVQGSFFAYYPQFFAKAQIGWNLNFNLEAFHLWFLRYLLCTSLLALPLYLWLKTPRGRHIAHALAGLAAGKALLLWLALPVALIQMALRAKYHGYMDWSDTLCWFYLFLAGGLFAMDDRLESAARKAAMPLLALAVACFATIGVLHGLGHVEPWETAPAYTPGYLSYEALRAFNTCAWLLALTGLAMRHLNRRPAWFHHLNEAVMPVYILHHVIIVALGYRIVQMPLGIPAKFILLLGGTALCTALLYLLAVRPFNPMRIAFGMTPRKRSRAA